MNNCEPKRDHLYEPLPCTPSLPTGELGECFDVSDCQVQPVPELVCPTAETPKDECLCSARGLTGSVFCNLSDEAVTEWLTFAECYLTSNRGECNCNAKALVAAHLFTITASANFDSHMLMSGAALGRIRYLPGTHWDRSIWGQMYQGMISRTSRPALSSGFTHNVANW